MKRLFLALFVSSIVGIVGSAVALSRSDAGFRGPDALGLVAVSLAIAFVMGLFVYAPASWLLQRRGVRNWIFGAALVALLANLPLFLALLIVQTIGGVFGAGEAWTVAALAVVIAAAHGVVAFRFRPGHSRAGRIDRAQTEPLQTEPSQETMTGQEASS